MLCTNLLDIFKCQEMHFPAIIDLKFQNFPRKRNHDALASKGGGKKGREGLEEVGDGERERLAY